MRTALLLLALLSLSASACKRKGGDAGGDTTNAPPGGGGPIAVEWVKENKFQIKGAPQQYAEVSVYKATYQVTAYGFPEGTKWSALDKMGSIDHSSLSILAIADVTPKLGDLPADQDKRRSAKIDPGASLKLELPDGSTTTVKLPPADPLLSVEEALKKVEHGPVTFGNEPPAKKPMGSILYPQGLGVELIGRADKIRDTYAVALATLLPTVKGTKKCTGYKDSKGNPMKDMDLQLKETEVVVYERRTGNVVQKKVFPPNKECPMFTFSRPDETSTDSMIPITDVGAWLKTLIKR
jgi:hypothetical protein